MTSTSITRRGFLKMTAGGAGLGATAFKTLPVSHAAPPSSKFVDVNVSLSRWPFRRLRLDQTDALVAKLKEQQITQAWAGTFDALLHKDLSSANARLVEECSTQGQGILLPIGSVNPAAPDWEEELRRCAEEHRMRGIRLHPNYHGYELTHPSFSRLLHLAAECGLIVQIAVLMEDERMMSPRLQVAPVSTVPLRDLISPIAKLQVVLLNALRKIRGPHRAELAASGKVAFEISMLEGAGGLERLLSEVPPECILFGSHAPLFYFKSAFLKLKESEVPEDVLRSICSGNAERMLAALRGRAGCP